MCDVERLYHYHLFFNLSWPSQTFGIKFVCYDFTLNFWFSALASWFSWTKWLSIFAFGAGGLCEHFLEARFIKVVMFFVMWVVGFVGGCSGVSKEVLVVEWLVFGRFIIAPIFHSFICQTINSYLFTAHISNWFNTSILHCCLILIFLLFVIR